MRIKRTTQLSVFQPQPVDHPLGGELESISNWLDAHPELLDAVAADLGAQDTVGRIGLSCETVLRCAVLKHLRGETWRGLAFALRDSRSACRFSRVDPLNPPKKSALQAGVCAVSAETWERVNRCLLDAALAAGVETGGRVRVDSTVTETHILAPADSRLLYDGVRVLAGLLVEARQRLGRAAVPCRDRRRAAKRRCLAIRTKRGKEARAKLYRQLLRIAADTLGDLDAAVPAVTESGAPWSARWLECAGHYARLLKAVAVQAVRRVLLEENVPAAEKIVSVFQPHTDIVRKGGRETRYGHKINLATGKSGLVLDVVVESGNPADSARCLPMLRRHCAHYGKTPDPCRLRRRLRFRGQPERRQGDGRGTRGVQQEARAERGRHVALAVDLRAAPALPRRRRGGHLLAEALLRSRTLPLARPAALQGLGAFGGLRAQPGANRAAAARIIRRDLPNRTVQYRNRLPGSGFGPVRTRQAESRRKTMPTRVGSTKDHPRTPARHESGGIGKRKSDQKTEFTDKN